MNQFSGRFLSAFARGILVSLAAIVPIVVFPWTIDVLDLNKQMVTIIFVVLAVVAWLGAALLRKEMNFRFSWLYLPLAAFLVSTSISGFVSLARYTSLVGQGGQEYTSIIAQFAFAAVFVVGLHVFSERKAQRVLWSVAVLASSLVAIMGSLVWFGVSFDVLPTNLIGTPDALVLYLLVMSVLGAGLWLTSGGEYDVLPSGLMGYVVRGAIVVTLLCTIAALVAIDYVMLWIVALVGVMTLFTFALARAREFPHPGRFILPMLLFVVSLLFVFLPTVVANPFPAEVAPTFENTWNIVRSNLRDTSMLFGSGPGTFALNYSQYQPVELNSTVFWDTRFDRGASHALTFLSTYGVIGALSLSLFVVLLFTLVIIRLVSERDHEQWKLTYAPFAAWLMVVVGVFVYAQNFTLAFLFWLLSAVLAAHVAETAKSFVFSRSPRAGLFAAFAFVVAAVCMLTTLFVTISRYRAEVAFARAVAADAQNGDLDDIIEHLDRAATVNRWSDIAYRTLGNALLFKTAEVIDDSSVDPNYIKSLIGAAINAAMRATELGPSNVQNWELRGDVYREVAPLVSDADAFAIASYEQAIALAPSHPRYHVSLARTYLVRASRLEVLIEGDDETLIQSAQDEYDVAVAKAETSLRNAITLKGDYASARYYLAFVQERQGKLADAIRSMELVRASNPSDVGVSMQLALLYLRQGKNDLAKNELERAIALVPNYANAYWYLASILEQEQDTSGALEALRVVQELNPDNEVVTKRIEQLEAGTVTEPIPEPIEETLTDALPEDTVLTP